MNTMINLQYFIDRNIFYTLLYDVLWFSHTIFGENSARVKLKKTNLNTSVIGLLLCYVWMKFRFFFKKLHSPKSDKIEKSPNFHLCGTLRGTYSLFV